MKVVVNSVKSENNLMFLMLGINTMQLQAAPVMKAQVLCVCKGTCGWGVWQDRQRQKQEV